MPRTLSEDDIIKVLEDIIKNSGNAQAKIAAIRALEGMRDGNETPAEAFSRLDELAPRRRQAA